MICSYCAAEMPEVSGFCPVCGKAVHPAEAPIRAGDLQEALLGAVAYVGILPAVLLLAIPATRKRAFVRFHAWQALLLLAATVLAGIAVKIAFLIFSFVPMAGFLFSWLLLGVVSIAVVILWLVLIVKALQGEAYVLPLIGPMSMRLTEMTQPADFAT